MALRDIPGGQKNLGLRKRDEPDIEPIFAILYRQGNIPRVVVAPVCCTVFKAAPIFSTTPDGKTSLNSRRTISREKYVRKLTAQLAVQN